MIWHKRAFPLEAIILCALILSETLALYKSFTYLLTYYAAFLVGHSIQFTFGSGCIWLADTARRAH